MHTGSFAAIPAPKGWPEARWQRFQQDTVAFRERWVDRAKDLGWTDLELFGVSRETPYALHAWGAVPFINGADVVDVQAERITIETRPDNRLTISKRKPYVDAVVVWDLQS